MVKLKYKQVTEYQKKAFFECEKCGTEIEFSHSTPFKCPNKDCEAKMPNLHLLIDAKDQNRRVKFFMEGEI